MYNFKKNKKIITLILMLILSALVLSGCYVEPDKTTSDDLTVGSDNVPFQNIVTPSPTPTTEPVVTSVPQETTTGSSTIDWSVFNPVTTDGTDVQVTDPGIITITATPTQKPIVTPETSSGSLKSGSKGQEVKELQQRLKELGYYNGSVDGAYGSGTTNAVKAFQAANKLVSDGVAGKATLAAVYSTRAVKASDANTSTTTTTTTTRKPTATRTPSPTRTPDVSNARYLKLGTSGADVRLIQNRLIDLGYLAGTADGEYGEATEKAVIAFQKVSQPYSDGIAGPETQKSLFSSNAKKASSPVAAIAKSGSSFREGDEGNAVRAIQKQLIKLGYLNGSADGSYGPSTKAAVMAFQAAHGLTQDGVAGSGTLNKMFSDSALPAGSSYVPNLGNTVTTNQSTQYQNTSVVSGTGYTTLAQGTSSSSVSNLQQKLMELGYYRGNVDGNYGSGTVDAVRAFQNTNRLTPDGVAGPTMQRLLFGNISVSGSYNKLELYKEGTDVYNMQYALYELGYYQGKVNGIFDQNTYGAVKEFQQNNGISVDGVAGTGTLQLLYSSFAKPAGLTTVNYETLQLGSRTDAVIQLQGRLVDLGYMVEPISGEYDHSTQAAIMTFQNYNGLTADGVAGAGTQSVLYSDRAVKKPIN